MGAVLIRAILWCVFVHPGTRNLFCVFGVVVATRRSGVSVPIFLASLSSRLGSVRRERNGVHRGGVSFFFLGRSVDFLPIFYVVRSLVSYFFPKVRNFRVTPCGGVVVYRRYSMRWFFLPSSNVS